MRRIVALMLVCILCFGMAGCQKHDYPWKLTKSKLEIPEQDVVLEIVEGTLTNRGIELRISNHGKQDFDAGSQFYLQLCVNKTWYDMGVDVNKLDWTAEAYPVGPGETMETRPDWSYIYGNLPAGKYRLVKPCTLDGQESVVSVEFEIP